MVRIGLLCLHIYYIRINKVYIVYTYIIIFFFKRKRIAINLVIFVDARKCEYVYDQYGNDMHHSGYERQ